VFPGNFESVGEARTFSSLFFGYYNNEHRHSGIGLNTPQSVHDGTWREIRERRQRVLDAAFAARPDRFRGAARWPQTCPPGSGSTSPGQPSSHRRPQG
jgi:putative transposase